MTTPAQASGHPNFVTDHPVQGPTDEGIRAADCHYRQNFLPARPACVDCEGPVPMWAQSKGLLGVSFGGVGVPGFALAAAGDPEIYSKLSTVQQRWIADVLQRLNTLIVSTTGSTCPTWAPAIPAASGCFQAWFNNINAGAPIRKLRTDGVFDQDTLDALIVTTQIHAADFANFGAYPKGDEKKLSTGAMLGIAAGGAAVVGGVVWLATRKKK